jgi:hypothetical protein
MVTDNTVSFWPLMIIVSIMVVWAGWMIVQARHDRHDRHDQTGGSGTPPPIWAEFQDKLIRQYQDAATLHPDLIKITPGHPNIARLLPINLGLLNASLHPALPRPGLVNNTQRC